MKKIKKALVFLMAFMLIAAAFPTMALAADDDEAPAEEPGAATEQPATPEDTGNEEELGGVDPTEGKLLDEPEEESNTASAAEITQLSDEVPLDDPPPTYAEPKIASVAAASGKVLGQQTSALSNGLNVSMKGTTITVTGTLNGITGWTQFSSIPNYQSGYYVAIVTTPGPDTILNLVAPVNGGPIDTNDDTSIIRIATKPTGPTPFHISASNPGDLNTVTYDIDLSGVTLQPGTIDVTSAIISNDAANQIVVKTPDPGLGTLSTSNFSVKKDNKAVSITTDGAYASGGYTITLPQAAVNGENYTVQITTEFQQSAVVDVKNNVKAISKAALESLIASAKSSSEGVIASDAASPSDVPKGMSYAPTTEYDALLNPLETADPPTMAGSGALAWAEYIDEKADATQEEINTAEDNLKSALTAFDAAKDVGTSDEAEPDITAVENAIAAAEKALDGVVEKANGTKPSEVAKGTKYYTPADLADVDPSAGTGSGYTTALAVAQAIVKSGGVGSTAGNIAKAAADLNTALAKLTGLIQTGTKDIDYSELEEAIETAKTFVSEIIISTNGSEVYSDNYWVTQAIMNPLYNAGPPASGVLALAEAMVKDNSANYPSDVLDMIEDLNDEVKKVDDAKQPGKLTRPAIEPDEDAPNQDIAVGPNDKLEAPAVTGLDAPAQGEAVPATNTASEFLQNFTAPDGYTMELRDEDDEAVVGNATICTGMILAIVDSNGDTVSEAIIIVKGDTAGNGCVSLTGAGRLARYIMGNDDALTAPQQAAGDMNGDGKLSTLDFGIMARMILGAQN